MIFVFYEIERKKHDKTFYGITRFDEIQEAEKWINEQLDHDPENYEFKTLAVAEGYELELHTVERAVLMPRRR